MIGLAAGEKLRDRAPGSDLFLTAVGQKIDEGQHGRASEGVTEKVYLVFCRKAFDQRFPRVIPAVALMPASGGMGGAVIDLCAGKLRVKLTRAVPGGASRIDRGGVAVKASRVEVAHQVSAEGSPIRQKSVSEIVFAPAAEPVHENTGVVRVPGFLVYLSLGKIRARDKEHDQCREKRYDSPHRYTPFSSYHQAIIA